MTVTQQAKRREGSGQQYDAWSGESFVMPYAFHGTECMLLFAGNFFEGVEVADFWYRQHLVFTAQFLEDMGFTALSEASFAEDWDNDADAAYDEL